MYGFHSAIIVAIVVTASLASNLLAIVTIGPAGTGTSALLRMRLGLRRSPRRVKRLVDQLGRRHACPARAAGGDLGIRSHA